MNNEWIGQFTDPPFLFLPVDVDYSELTEITTIGAMYRKFTDPKTGKIYDCETYHRQSQKGCGD